MFLHIDDGFDKYLKELTEKPKTIITPIKTITIIIEGINIKKSNNNYNN